MTLPVAAVLVVALPVAAVLVVALPVAAVPVVEALVVEALVMAVLVVEVLVVALPVVARPVVELPCGIRRAAGISVRTTERARIDATGVSAIATAAVEVTDVGATGGFTGITTARTSTSVSPANATVSGAPNPLGSAGCEASAP